jgi:hypothetical protein
VIVGRYLEEKGVDHAEGLDFCRRKGNQFHKNLVCVVSWICEKIWHHDNLYFGCPINGATK